MRTRTLMLMGAVLASCATAPRNDSMAQAPEDFQPTGVVSLYDRIVSFDADTVRSPVVNLGARDDGRWVGRIGPRQVFASVEGDAVRGPNMNMVRDMSDPSKVVISGQFHGDFFRFELDRENATLQGPNFGRTLRGRSEGTDWLMYGVRGKGAMPGALELTGAAAELAWPQVGFALLGVVPVRT